MEFVATQQKGRSEQKGRASICLAIALAVFLATGLAAAAPNGTERVSLTNEGGQADSGSAGPAISADGRYVAFASGATNLVAGDTNGLTDVFVRDRVAAMTERVSVSSSGAEANDESMGSTSFLGFDPPSISADGRYVAFDSFASNLVPGDTNAEVWEKGWIRSARDVFVRDRQTATTERVSVATDGTQADFSSLEAAISANGRFVAFTSYADNLVPNDRSGADIFVHDRVTGVTERVNVDSAGNEATHPYGPTESRRPSISGDGRFVAFDSLATNLVADDNNSNFDVFVHDRLTGATERASVSSSEAEGNGFSASTSISADGRFVMFESGASNLVPGDTNGGADYFVRDRLSGTTERVSVSTAGEQAGFDDNFGRTAISADGRFAAWESGVSNLVPDDTNGVFDIFVRDRVAGTTERISLASDGAQADANSFQAALSGDGRFVAFLSYATNLVSGDTNGTADDFVRDRGSQLRYTFIGFFPPVRNLPALNVIQAGRAVPLKFSLGGSFGLDVLAPGYPKSAPLRCGSGALLEGTETTETAGRSGLSFDPAGDVYTYVWKTSRSWAGTCRQFVLKLNDGQVVRANFRFVATHR
jgi:Tol biopolymer transport system component